MMSLLLFVHRFHNRCIRHNTLNRLLASVRAAVHGENMALESQAPPHLSTDNSTPRKNPDA